MKLAPRLTARLWRYLARGALLAWVLVAAPGAASGEGIVSARYVLPTDRYTHGILGDAIEWGGLEIRTSAGALLRITLPSDRVFEDTEPRLIDVDLDGDAEVVVVETHIPRGARLAIYDATGLLAATPHIGRTNRWLAPLGGADLDGDGRVELAYVDRPHLAKELLVWRFWEGGLRLVARAPGLTNHRIGETDIAGGIRDCGEGPEMITATADWSAVVATVLSGNTLNLRRIGPHLNRQSFADALACRL
ncbi:MAG: VCBS repeat-containing protein [Pseudomonadota bacterium]